MSSSVPEKDTRSWAAVTALEYSDVSGDLPLDGTGNSIPKSISWEGGTERRKSESDLAERIKRERTDAAQQAEQQLRQEHGAQLQLARNSIAEAIRAFEGQRDEYFARAEAEVVQLALSIAAKILHREAQVDSMLVAALVRMTIDKMQEGSRVTVRVNPLHAGRWKEYFATLPNMARVEVTADPTLSNQDCILETELGAANFGLETQLKEIERGFFDLLALRPEKR